MTSETDGVAVRYRLERTFLQPEVVPDVFRRLCHVLFTRLSLRLICLMTDRTARRDGRLLFLEGNRNKSRHRFQLTHHVDMFVVRESNAELRNKLAALQF